MSGPASGEVHKYAFHTFKLDDPFPASEISSPSSTSGLAIPTPVEEPVGATVPEAAAGDSAADDFREAFMEGFHDSSL